MRIFRILLAGIFLFVYAACGALAAADLDRTQLRALCAGLAELPCLESSYEEAPRASAPYCTGALRQEVLEGTLDYLNVLRAVAGLDPVQLSDALNETAQAGALLQAALGELSHTPDRPEGMSDQLYQKGYDASSASNLARFNWSGGDLLREAALCFALDDSGENLLTLSHRRWLLYPYMRYTGFGLASNEAGYTSAAMYVMDDSNQDAQYDLICWPAQGAFPAEWMTSEMAWSISPNPANYDLQASNPRITLTEEGSGAQFDFSEQSNADPDAGAYFRIGGGRYGDGPAYIFRPALDAFAALADGYCQNQVFTVRLSGMISSSGEALADIVYQVQIVSLSPVDPADVELAAPAEELCVGERMQLSAQVVPTWADDLTVCFESSNPAVAQVDEQGMVTALSPGQTILYARSANGRQDAFALRVAQLDPGS